MTAPDSILDEIVASKRREVASARQRMPLEEMEVQAASRPRRSVGEKRAKRGQKEGEKTAMGIRAGNQSAQLLRARAAASLVGYF